MKILAGTPEYLDGFTTNYRAGVNQYPFGLFKKTVYCGVFFIKNEKCAEYTFRKCLQRGELRWIV